MLAGNNSTFRTADNIRDTARRLRAAARGNRQRQQRIRTIEANYLRGVGSNRVIGDEYAVTNDAGSVLTKVRGNKEQRVITRPYTLTYTPTAAKANSNG